MLPQPLLIIVATIVQFVVGALWYSILFGKNWARIMGMDRLAKADLEKLQKTMGPFYGLEFLLTLLTTIALDSAISFYSSINRPLDYTARVEFGLTVAFFLWLCCIVPTQISGVIWSNTKREYWPQQIAIMAGMKCIGMLLATLILVL